MSNAHVLGLGQSGYAAARLLKAKGWQVQVSDRGESLALTERKERLNAEGIAVSLGHMPILTNDRDRQAAQINLFVVSPGIPWDHPLLLKARELGIETIGEIELAWRYLKACPWVGITGTNGKTTTTALTAAIFQFAGLNAPACGNIGLPACELALAPILPDWIIAELSSYQIESASGIQPRIGIWTTFTPDHLNRHYTIEAYGQIKASLMHQSERVVLNGDDPYLFEHGSKLWKDAVWTCCSTQIPAAIKYGACIKDDWVLFAGAPILPLASFKLLGKHNLQNLLMAVAAAKLAGIESTAIEQAVKIFKGVPHRLEMIGTYQGISLINDSKATNYDAAVVGLQSVTAPAILIAGGEPKQGDWHIWLAAIKAKVSAVLLIGQAATEFAEMLESQGYHNYENVKTLEQAVPRAVALAQQLKAPTILFSPACASFDQYANFEERGDHFRQLCLNLEVSSKG